MVKWNPHKGEAHSASYIYEAYASEKDTRVREHHLKRFSGAYIHLKKRIENSLKIT
ncbi:MAG: hypothetical protein G01um101433_524 [Parcubacteria group bacterium Gr01-1014_33]|nr:MAG: hypothetical protein G01um101433_524 [Parcubacteria group bacterium Gr01-1014_33]